MTLLRAVPVWFVLLLALGLAGRIQADTITVESPWEIATYPAVTNYATSHGIAVKGIEFAAENTASRPGDEIIYLLTLQQAAGRTQWLVRLTSRLPDPTKGEAVPLNDDTLHTSTGLELRYTNTPAALEIEFIGPFAANGTANARVTVSRGRVIVSAESLQLGLVRYCESSVAIAARMKTAGIDNPFYTGSSAKFKPAQIEAGRKAVAPFGLTAEDERLAFSVYFALRSFYQACSEIPACRDVLEQVIQKPSLWSLARNLGAGMNFEYGWHRVITLPPDDLLGGAASYQLPLRLSVNQQPALQAALSVTTTRPPLRTCAGIIALAAGHPTDPNKRVFLRLLSAHPAKP